VERKLATAQVMVQFFNKGNIGLAILLPAFSLPVERGLAALYQEVGSL
jgi:hypothetical protein